MPDTHTVNENDGLNTLSKISQKYGVSLQEVKSLNPALKGRRPSYWIYPGDIIKLPTCLETGEIKRTRQKCPEPAKGRLSIVVVDDSKTPIKDATVFSPILGAKETNDKGAVDYGLVDAGEYAIGAWKDFYTSDQDNAKTATVRPGAPTVETLVLHLELSSLSSEKSAKVKKPPKDAKVIYLTCDDGPEAGTKEIYELFSELKVPATFFMVGESAIRYEATEKGKGFLKKLYKDEMMQLCNHSHTHAHQIYKAFYKDGLRINAVTLEPDANDATTAVARRSVLMDFEYANIAFTQVLTGKKVRRPTDPRHDARGKLDAKKLTGYARFLSARMPGSNIWRLLGITANLDPLWPYKFDEADDLTENGYKLFGWDHEFLMKFEIRYLLEAEFRKGKDVSLDLYDSAHIDLDRPTDTGEEVFEKVKDEFDEGFPDLQKENKLILLLHDRAFRRYKKGEEKKHLNELRTFIELCQKEGFKFDVVENY